jgi:hypothetical protein
LVAQAQPLPSYASPDTQRAPAPPAPPPSYAHNEEQISGRISSIPGKYDIEIRDSRGYIDRVRLRDGTVINPTGIRLATGMSVTVFGVNRGQVFEASEINTPYNVYGYAYPAYGPYPAYPVTWWGYSGYPYPYYGGVVGIGIGIGWSGYYGGWRGYYGYRGWAGYRGWR